MEPKNYFFESHLAALLDKRNGDIFAASGVPRAIIYPDGERVYPNLPTFREVEEYNDARRVVMAEIPS